MLLLLFRHSAKSENAQDERPATSPYMVTRRHLPHAIVVRMNVRTNNVVILTPEMTINRWCLSISLSLSVGYFIQDEATDVSIEFALGHLGVTNSQASDWLKWGWRSGWPTRVNCWRASGKRLIASMRGAIDSTRARTSGSLH